MKILPAIISIIMLLALCAANLFADGPYDEDYVPRVGATPAPPGSGGSVKRGEEWGKQSQATPTQARESSSNQWTPPEEICSRDKNYCVKIVPDEQQPDQCNLVVSSKDRVLAQFVTMGYLLDVFYSADNRYVAINNRRANAGDYLWVISLRDGQPLKIPEDVATELGKKELGQISRDHFPPDQAIPEVTALCRDCTPDNLNHPFLFSRDWKSSDELNVVEEFHFFGKGAYGPGASGVWIAVNKVCRITAKGLSLVKRSIEKETQPSELVKRAWTWSPFHVASHQDAVRYRLSDKDYLHNPNLPPDSVELSPDVKPPDGAYYKSPPEDKPSNVPDDYVLIKVYQRGAVLGWCYMNKSKVERLHTAKTQTEGPK